MKILITGGAGFVGSNLADALIERGDEVVIVDNLTTGREENVNPKAKFHNITLGDDPISPETDISLIKDWKGVDVVVHAAASYKDPDDWMRDTDTNVRGAVQLLKAMKVHKVERIIYFQTALMYGKNPKSKIVPGYPHEWNEKHNNQLDINTPQDPDCSYAISKTAAENYIAMSGLDFVSFRLANCYGPRNLSGPIPTFWKRLKEGKECWVADTRRDFIYIDDLLEVVLKAIDGTGSGFYHVSSGNDVSIEDIYRFIRNYYDLPKEDVDLVSEPDDAPSILLSPGATNKEFDWLPKVKLLSGLMSALEWYDKFGVDQTYTHLKVK